jgi:hypothetical protein
MPYAISTLKGTDLVFTVGNTGGADFNDWAAAETYWAANLDPLPADVVFIQISDITLSADVQTTLPNLNGHTLRLTTLPAYNGTRPGPAYRDPSWPELVNGDANAQEWEFDGTDQGGGTLIVDGMLSVSTTTGAGSFEPIRIIGNRSNSTVIYRDCVLIDTGANGGANTRTYCDGQAAGGAVGNIIKIFNLSTYRVSLYVSASSTSGHDIDAQNCTIFNDRVTAMVLSIGNAADSMECRNCYASSGWSTSGSGTFTGTLNWRDSGSAYPVGTNESGIDLADPWIVLTNDYDDADFHRAVGRTTVQPSSSGVGSLYRAGSATNLLTENDHDQRGNPRPAFAGAAVSVGSHEPVAVRSGTLQWGPGTDYPTIFDMAEAVAIDALTGNLTVEHVDGDVSDATGKQAWATIDLGGNDLVITTDDASDAEPWDHRQVDSAGTIAVSLQEGAQGGGSITYRGLNWRVSGVSSIIIGDGFDPNNTTAASCTVRDCFFSSPSNDVRITSRDTPCTVWNVTVQDVVAFELRSTSGATAGSFEVESVGVIDGQLSFGETGSGVMSSFIARHVYAEDGWDRLSAPVSETISNCASDSVIDAIGGVTSGVTVGNAWSSVTLGNVNYLVPLVGSSLRDAGTASTLIAANTTDMLGNPRPAPATNVDIGPTEYQP